MNKPKGTKINYCHAAGIYAVVETIKQFPLYLFQATA